MTHHSRFRFPRLAAAAVALAAAGLLAGGTAASAGVTPTPTPLTTSPSDHHHHQRLAPEQFDITITNVNPSGDVEAFGPVAMHLGTDQTNTAFRDTLSDGAGDTVKVDHDELPLPVVDLDTCSLLFIQQHGRWQFDGGTGIWRGATGRGVFDLLGLVSFEEHHGKCRALEFTSPERARWDIEHNVGPAPVIFSFSVQATGRAAVRPVRPCINHFAPTASPSLTAKLGGPDPQSTCDPRASAA
jgi:hypothetical protein